MSKKMKKLISALLSAAMVLSCVAVPAFADETPADAQATIAPAVTDDPDATPEPTEEPIGEGNKDVDEADAEVTEEPATPEPTAEPTPVPSKYENDSYYDRALTLCEALGIILGRGEDEGGAAPDSHVTRAEMAAIVLRMLNTTAIAEYANSFNDVTSDHWAANDIQTAASLGIIVGNGDGSFTPDGDVTYEQVVKMIICALGYEREAQVQGGYPMGYIGKADDLDLLDNAVGSQGVAADRGLVIKMVYNALLTYLNELDSQDAMGNPTYKATRTLAKAKFNLIDEKGILTATPNKSVDPSLATLREGSIAIDGKVYKTDVTGIDEYVGMQVTYFYSESVSIIDPVILAIVPTGKKSTQTEVDLDDVKELTGFENGQGFIDMDKGTDYRCRDAVITYNGQIITAADYARASAETPDAFTAKDYDGNPKTGVVKTFNEFLLPDVGSINLTDSDGDGYYDYIFIESYETMVVSSVSSKTLSGDIAGTLTSISVDTTANPELKLSVIRAGSEVKARNLSTNDVASISRSLDKNNIKIEVTGETVTGTVDSVYIEDDKRVAEIGGDVYEVDVNAKNDVVSGAEGTFYLDKFDRIGYAVATGAGKTSGNEKYGWLMNVYKSSNGKDTMARMFTQDGKVEALTLSSKVNFWANGARSAESVSPDVILNAVEDNDFLMTNETDSAKQIRLCKYRANSSGQVTQLYLAVGSDTISDDGTKTFGNGAVIVDTTNLRGAGNIGQSVDGHEVSASCMRFNVPIATKDMNTPSEYSIETSSFTNYQTNETLTIDAVLGEFVDNKATIAIHYNSSANAAAPITDYGTANDNPTMVVSSVSQGVDANGDTTYLIKGRRNGSEVSYTTSSNAALYYISTSGPQGNQSDRSYGGSLVWDAITENNGGKKLTSELSEGDIIGIQTASGGASVLIKLVDVSNLADTVAINAGSQWVGAQDMFSNTRDGYHVGPVDNINASGDQVYFSVGTSSWYLSSSTAIDVVTVTTDANGFVKADVESTTYEPGELMRFQTNNIIGDYIYSRHFRYGSQREAVVFRFNDN